MRISLGLIAAALVLLVARISHADQYAYIPRAVCTNAASFVPSGSIVLSFCSQCDGQHVEIWKVKQPLVVDVQYENRFQLTLYVEKLYRSKRAFDEGKYQEPVQFEKVPHPEKSLAVEGVDLAYLYVRKPDGSFHVLAKEMNLGWLHCAVDTIRLPAPLANSLRN